MVELWKIVAGALVLSFSAMVTFTLREENQHKINYAESQKPIVATVLEETRENELKPVSERHISGLVSQAYSNETVRVDSRYVLKLKTDDGKTLGVSIRDSPRIDKEALDAIVDVGTRISFPKGNFSYFKRRRFGAIPEETYFYNDTRFGNKRASRITVLDE